MARDTDNQKKKIEEENRSTNNSREDYTNLRGVYITKAVVQFVFAFGVIYTAYSDFSLLPLSALIYLTGTLFDFITALAMNRGPKYKLAVIITKVFQWVNIIAEAAIGFIVLYRVDISEQDSIVFWAICISMICLGVMSSVVELILNRPNDD